MCIPEIERYFEQKYPLSSSSTSSSPSSPRGSLGFSPLLEIDRLSDRLNILATVGAVAPFVGLFIARISIGRTIREFIGGALFVTDNETSQIHAFALDGEQLDWAPTDLPALWRELGVLPQGTHAAFTFSPRAWRVLSPTSETVICIAPVDTF